MIESQNEDDNFTVSGFGRMDNNNKIIITYIIIIIIIFVLDAHIIYILYLN